MRVLPSPPPGGITNEWASQNNRIMQLELQRIDTAEQRIKAVEDELSGDLEAINALTGTGMLARTGTDTWALREIRGTAGKITVTNGDGVSGAPTITFPAAVNFSAMTITAGTYSGPTITGTWTATGATCSDLGSVTTADINGGTIDNTSIGATTPASGVFSTFTATRSVAGSVRYSFENTEATAFRQTDIRIGRGTNTQDVYLGVNYTGTQGAFIDNRSGGNFEIKFSGTTEFTLTSTGINSTPIGATTPSTGAFTTLSCTGNATLGDASTDTVAVAGRLYGTALHNNAGGMTGTTNQYVGSGTYTPTATAITNVGSANTTYSTQYLRVGNVVTLSGKVDVDILAAGNTVIDLSLPIASALTSAEQCCGTAVSSTGIAAYITANSTNDRIRITFTGTAAVVIPFYFHLTYVVL